MDETPPWESMKMLDLLRKRDEMIELVPDPADVNGILFEYANEFEDNINEIAKLNISFISNPTWSTYEALFKNLPNTVQIHLLIPPSLRRPLPDIPEEDYQFSNIKASTQR